MKKHKKKKRPARCYVEELHQWMSMGDAVEHSLGSTDAPNGEVPLIVVAIRDFLESVNGRPLPDREVYYEGLPEFLIEEGFNPQKYLTGNAIPLLNQAWLLYRTTHPHKISKLSLDTETTEPEVKRSKLFGLSITSILRWMGMDSWSYEEASLALSSLGFEMATTTIKIQLKDGKKATERYGKPAQLTDDQIAVLYDTLSEKSNEKS